MLKKNNTRNLLLKTQFNIGKSHNKINFYAGILSILLVCFILTIFEIVFRYLL